jgi:ABC-type proline/glycine betaine transport system permease subunit
MRKIPNELRSQKRNASRSSPVKHRINSLKHFIQILQNLKCINRPLRLSRETVSHFFLTVADMLLNALFFSLPLHIYLNRQAECVYHGFWTAIPTFHNVQMLNLCLIAFGPSSNCEELLWDRALSEVKSFNRKMMSIQPSAGIVAKAT